MIWIKEGKKGYLWLTVTWPQGRDELPPAVAATVMYTMQLARTAPIALRTNQDREKKYHLLFKQLASWPEAKEALKEATHKDVEATLDLLKEWGWLQDYEHAGLEEGFTTARMAPGSEVVDFILNDIAKGESMREATMETVMIASLHCFPKAMGASAISVMVQLVGHSITFRFWSNNRLAELTEALLGRTPDDLVQLYLTQLGHQEVGMMRLRESMPDMALWPFCWNLIW
eukprot:54791-Rhodomonas_salina.1